MNLFKLILSKIKEKYIRSSSDRYILYLKNSGVTIGNNAVFLSPKTCSIDLTRPSLIEIGNDCFFNRGFTLLTHDWVSRVSRNAYSIFLPSSGKVKIGNNVSFGFNVTILKGVTIGDNVFIGLGSVVTRDIPSNSIVAGIPARVICSLESYIDRRKKESLEEAFDYVSSIEKRLHRQPKISDFQEEFIFFIDKNNISEYLDFKPIIKSKLGKSYEHWLNNHKAPFKSFEDFIRAANNLHDINNE